MNHNLFFPLKEDRQLSRTVKVFFPSAEKYFKADGSQRRRQHSMVLTKFMDGQQLQNFCLELLLEENGSVASEYAILVSLIAVGIVATVGLFGAEVQKLYEESAKKLFP
jgi:Flp pilus assembly pilin Flp